MFSYYGIAGGFILSVVNYFILGLALGVDNYYLHSFEVWLACTFVISERFGSRVRLCAVLTTARLAPDEPFAFGESLPDFCHTCGYRCVKACPAAALSKPGHVDHYRCLAIRPADRAAEMPAPLQGRPGRGGWRGTDSDRRAPVWTAPPRGRP